MTLRVKLIDVNLPTINAIFVHISAVFVMWRVKTGQKRLFKEQRKFVSKKNRDKLQG